MHGARAVPRAVCGFSDGVPRAFLVVPGDLWELLHAILIWRGGANTTIVKWCKGHAEDAHVTAGITDRFRQWGNGVADTEAEAAHNMISDCEHLCREFRARQGIYADFLAAIHAMFVRVIRAETLPD